MVCRGIRHRRRQDLESQAHLLRILITRMPFQKERKPPSIEQMIGPSEEDMEQMEKKKRELKKKTAKRRAESKKRGRIIITG